MKKSFLLALSALMLFAMLAGVYAKKEDGQEGASNTAHLTFSPYEETELSARATGRMRYNLSGEELCFTFNGKGLVPGECYKLICYSSGVGGGALRVVCLGEGTANGGGNVHINTCTNTGDLVGVMIILVLCGDVDCGEGFMTGEHPELYLFGTTLSFDDTDDPENFH